MALDVKALQRALSAHGRPVIVDGVLGPKTWTALISHVSGRTLKTDDMGAAMHRVIAAGINTPLRLAHFLAQAAHETGGFRYMKEIWGPTPAQRRYEGRADLGNTQPGDGHRFMGRGIFQLTGRANYTRFGPKVGVDLIAHPEKAAEPVTAVLLAIAYWNDRGLSAHADRDDLIAITRRINGGVNGLADRQHALARAKQVLR